MQCRAFIMTDFLNHLDGSGRFGKRRAGQGNSLSNQQAKCCCFAGRLTWYIKVVAVFSEMQNTYDRGSAPVFLFVLICSFKVWICMSEWWTACACVCLMPGFSSKRMEKHWAFYFHESYVLFFLHLPDPLMHILIFSQ